MYREIQTELLGDLERKRGSLVSAVFFFFLLTTVVWCTCPLRHPETGQNEDKVQVSIVSHLFPEARDLDFVKMS